MTYSRGIQTVSTALTDGTLQIHESCPELIKEIPNYVWDATKQDKGEDVPVKLNDHSADALRYGVIKVFRPPALRVVSNPMVPL